MKRLSSALMLVREAFNGWNEHKGLKMGASLAFYTCLALAPLTIIAITIAGYFFGAEAARGGIVEQIEALVGFDGAVLIESLIRNASERPHSRIETIVTISLFLACAMGVFAELKDSLDSIWEVKRKPGLGWLTFIRTQLLSFALVVGSGFLLLVSLLLTALLTALATWLKQWLPLNLGLAYVLDVLVSFVIITLLFALIFKMLPDITVPWRDVWLGSVVTALLFMTGKFLIGVYIGSAHVGSIYGAAGSLVIILVWTYYSSQILFFGAELIRAYAKLYDPDRLNTARAQ